MRLFVPEILFYRLPDNRPIEKKTVAMVNVIMVTCRMIFQEYFLMLFSEQIILTRGNLNKFNFWRVGTIFSGLIYICECFTMLKIFSMRLRSFLFFNFKKNIYHCVPLDSKLTAKPALIINEILLCVWASHHWCPNMRNKKINQIPTGNK